MQALKYQQAINLNNALTSTEVVEIGGQQINKTVLKSGRFLSSEAYLTLMIIKKKLRNSLDELSEREKELIESYDGRIFGGSWALEATEGKDVSQIKSETKELNKKLTDLQKVLVVEISNPFIDQKEFLEWTKECSNEVASILAEFLLKDFDKKS